MRQKDVLGRRGEQVAAEYLERAGFRILDRNCRCSGGEIDIVAADRRELVACEVKTRSDVRYGAPVVAVTSEKLRRLRRLAVRWVLAHGPTFFGLRVDIVGVLRSAVSWRASISPRACSRACSSSNSRSDVGSAELRARLQQAEAALAASAATSPLAGIAGRADARRIWEALDLGRRRALVRAVMQVTILPVRPGRGFKPESVDIRWR